MPIVTIRFERVGIDIVGSLVPAISHHRLILVLVNYATQYPEVIPLQNIWAETMACELVQVFRETGIPKQVITGQRSSFMGEVLQAP